VIWSWAGPSTSSGSNPMRAEFEDCLVSWDGSYSLVNFTHLSGGRCYLHLVSTQKMKAIRSSEPSVIYIYIMFTFKYIFIYIYI